MGTPYDPGRPEDRPGEQPGFPAAPPPQDYGQQYPQGGQPGQNDQGYPPAPGYGQQQPYAGGPNYPGGGFGSAPAYGNAGYGMPPGRPQLAPPADVLRAVQLMFVRVAISIISALITFTSGDAVRDSIRESDPSLTAEEVDQAYNLGVGVAIFFGLVFAVLYILLAIQVRKGKNWARIVTWVLAGLGVLGGLLGLFGASTGLEKGFSVVQLLVDAAIIVLLARKPANDYFTAMNGPRY